MSIWSVKTRTRRRWIIALVPALVCALISCGVVYLVSARRHVTRFYAFAGYVNAIRHLEENDLPIPDSITEIEDVYNNYEHRRVDLPSPPWFLRPTFRPVGGLSGGPYLVLIENKPRGLQDWTRYVVYINGDGSDVHLENVNECDLPSLIAKDDELRGKNAATTTQNAAPSP